MPDPELESSFFQRVTLAAKFETSAAEEALSVDPLLNAATLGLLPVSLAIANAAPTNAPQPTKIVNPVTTFSRPFLMSDLFSNFRSSESRVADYYDGRLVWQAK